MDPGLILLGEGADCEANATVRAGEFFLAFTALERIFKVGLVAGVVPAALYLPGWLCVVAERSGWACFSAFLTMPAELHNACIDRLVYSQWQIGEQLEDAYHRTEFRRDEAVQPGKLPEPSQYTKGGGNPQGIRSGFAQAHISQSAQELLS